MQTTTVQKHKRFEQRQMRRLALIIGLVASLAIAAMALMISRTGEDADESLPLVVAPKPQFSESLDKGMLSPSVGQREQHEVTRREGLLIGASENVHDLPEHGKGIIPGSQAIDVPVEVQEFYLPKYGKGIIP